MELAPTIYAQIEDFPKSETFGLRMQLRRSAVGVATHIADGHRRLTDAENRKSLRIARGSLNELQTQMEPASSLKFMNENSADQTFELATEVAKTDQRTARSCRERNRANLRTRDRAQRR